MLFILANILSYLHCLEFKMNPVLNPPDNKVVSTVIVAMDRGLSEINAGFSKSRKVSDLEWIKDVILSQLAQEGKNLGYKVSGHGQPKPAWLYDLMWKGAESNQEPALVVECPLGSEYFEIKDDFEKLLMAGAELRLMITYSGINDKDFEHASRIVSKLKEKISFSTMTQAGDCFLFAAIIAGKENIYTIHYEIVEKE